MEEDLYKKYLKNIKESKTAIKKEYVDSGYFSYYTRREIFNHINSERIVIDGLDISFNDFIDNTYKMIKNNYEQKNKVLYLGKINKKLSDKFKKYSNLDDDISNFHISIGTDAIKHVIKKHSGKDEYKRGQKPITKEDLKIIPRLLMNSEIIVYMGKSKDKRKIYKFISKDNNGTYNLLDFINNNRKQLGFQSLYIIQTKEQKKVRSLTE